MKHKNRFKKISSRPEESPVEQRKAFPDKLVKAFVAVAKSKWADKEYAHYVKLAREFLGEAKWAERIEQGMLTVKLTMATFDLMEPKPDETKKEKPAKTKKAKEAS
jgi:hypothetical protein